MGAGKVRAAMAATILAGSVAAMAGPAAALSFPPPSPRPVQQPWRFSGDNSFLRDCPGNSAYDPYAGQCSADSDRDGLADSYETGVLHTDPHGWDTDGDGLPDTVEVLLGTDPTTPNRLPRWWFGGAW